MSGYKRREKTNGINLPKEEYIALINKELKQINKEYYLRIIYLLAKKYKEEGN